MPGFIDLTGQRFGRLTVIERANTGKPRGWWKCLCDCGNETIVQSDSLRRGSTKSCGCYGKERALEAATKHGHGGRKNRSRLYRTWSGMIQRTTNPKDKYYYNYGGRGIGVCPEWRESFPEFQKWAEDTGYKDDLYIDRIDNEKGYSPDNCRWVTRFQQQNNLRCNVRYRFLDGKSFTQSEMAKALCIEKRHVHKSVKSMVIKEAEINEKSGKPHLFILNCNPEALFI